MYSRLIIACVVSLAALTGCKHRASLDGVEGPSASISSVGSETVAAAHPETASRFNPFQALEDLFARRSPDETVVAEDVDAGEDPIQYVEPVAMHAVSAKDSGGDVRGEIVDGDLDEREVLPPYTLDTGDRIRVFVYGQPNLTRVYSVNDQGYVSVPLVGSVLARGLSTRALQGVIKRGLEKKYVKDAQVSIEVAVYRPFFIHGEVRTPGQFPYAYGMTVDKAVATAGGYSPRASKRGITVTRSIDGVRDVIDVAPSDYIFPGDTVMVDERFF